MKIDEMTWHSQKYTAKGKGKRMQERQEKKGRTGREGEQEGKRTEMRSDAEMCYDLEDFENPPLTQTNSKPSIEKQDYP
jgi:hypothetical protein